MRDYVLSSHRRLAEARRIADGLLHNQELHQLAMKTVFILEDCHETFVRLQREQDDRRFSSPVAVT